MSNGFSLRMGFGAAALWLAASAAQAATPAFMSEGAVVAPPPGYAALCQRDPDICGAPPAVRPQMLALAGPAFATSSLGGSALAVPSADLDASGPAMISLDSLQAFHPVQDRILAKAAPLTIDGDVLTPAAAAPSAQITTTRLTKEQMALINRVNRDVNREVNKASDFDLYGLLEYWSTPLVVDGKMYGDCEDYALEKRRRLIAAGVPAADLSMAVAVTARGESHAVLIVAFDSGDMVLDNLTPWATPWAALNYRWIQRQVAGSTEWAAIL